MLLPGQSSRRLHSRSRATRGTGALVSGDRADEGYGWLTRTFSDPAVALLLLAAGVLIGFGAKTAGGCTAGNGLSGNAFGSRAALTATATFMAVAVAASFVTKWIWGAAL